MKKGKSILAMAMMASVLVTLHKVSNAQIRPYANYSSSEAALSSFLNVLSSAQNKGLDVFYSCLQPAEFITVLKPKIGAFSTYNRNLKTHAIAPPDTFTSNRSDVPLL